MIVGIPTDDGKLVSEHFGRSKFFVIADIENGKSKGRKIIENPHDKEINEQSGHGKLLKVLMENHVNKVICFNINPRMEKNLNSLKITVEKCADNSAIDKLIK
jgi:predicted Fe-Mo cluster-binding NifX family protein